MPKLKFFDVKAKKSFTTDKFRLMIKDTKVGKRKFAIAVSPLTGIESYRIVSMSFNK